MISDATAVGVRTPEVPERQLAAFEELVVLRGGSWPAPDVGGHRPTGPQVAWR